MKHLFIINPAAGGKDKTGEISAKIHEAMKEISPLDAYEIYVTKGPMDASRAVSEKAKDGLEIRVYACGGDGTLNECVNGAVGLQNVALTHYPVGTGNDFCKMFGRDAEKFRDLKLLVGGQESPIDLINCNGRYSINICSVGIDARIGTAVHNYSKIPFIPGKLGYIISTIVNIIKGINQFFTITCGEEVFEGEFAMVCACNGQYYGGFFNPVPEAQPDDGLIDFLIVKKVSRIEFLKLVMKFKDGRYKEMPEYISHVQAKSMNIACKQSMVINVDGEIAEGNAANFTVEAGKLRFFYPQEISCNKKLTIKSQEISKKVLKNSMA
jgi:lipid kinase, YegS/Rv2252/BmrU family